MKYFRIILLGLTMIFLLTGCEFELKSPDSLIAPPMSNEERAQQKKIITEFLEPGEYLTVPAEMDNPTAYLVEDFDHDGQEEMLAFYHSADNNYEQSFMILEEDVNVPGSWHKAQQVTEVGSEIKMFKAIDMDGDGQEEFLFGVKGYTEEYLLYCYTYNGGQWEKLGRIQYDALRVIQSDTGNFLIVMLRDTSSAQPTSQINIYSFVREDILNRFETSLDGYCIDAVYGAFSQTRSGIGLVMRHNEYYTIALLMAAGDGYTLVMDEPLAYNYGTGDKIEVFQDINNDNILEVCYLEPPTAGGENHGLQEYLRVWYQWQEGIGMQAVQAVLANVGDGFEFYIPTEWIAQVEYEFGRAQGMDWIDFYRKAADDSPRVKLFAIAAVDSYTWEQEDQLQKEQMIILGNNPNKKKIYVAMMSPLPEGVEITENQLIACLSIVGGK